jgi:Tfp pilus assembly protein FimV
MKLLQSIMRIMTFFAGCLCLPAVHASESAIDAALATLFAEGDVETHISERRESEILQGKYEVRPGDTLDGIIDLAFPGSAIRKSMLRQAVMERNPHAFRGNNPNWLLAGVAISIPEAHDIHALLFEDYASIRDRYPADTSGWVRFP